jgi:biotin carboxylase
MKNQCIISLGAGDSQLLVIRKLKEMRFAVIGVDRNAEAPGLKFCDEYLELSTYDSFPIIRQLKILQEKYNILGVVNRSSGPPVITCAEICEYFNLPGVPSKSARIIINKAKLNLQCKKAGVKVPDAQVINNISQLDRKKIVFPSVVKPALSIIGKSGVNVVSNFDEISSIFLKAKKAALNGWVLVEEYVSGQDVSLMGMVSNKKLRPIVLLDEINLANLQGSISGAAYALPSVFTGAPEEEQLISIARNIINAFDLDTTFFIMSCRVANPKNIWLIEIHLDLGGDLILDQLIPAATKFDVLQAAIDNLIGKGATIDGIFFKPSVLIYGKGKSLISQRPYKIFQTSTREKLSQTIETGIADGQSFCGV